MYRLADFCAYLIPFFGLGHFGKFYPQRSDGLGKIRLLAFNMDGIPDFKRAAELNYADRNLGDKYPLPDLLFCHIDPPFYMIFWARTFPR